MADMPKPKTPTLQNAADAAEKYGDTATQDRVKKMQYPAATDKQGYTDYSKLPSEARQQRYRTQDKAQPPSFAKGGKVRKTGMAKVHKGERVLTKAQQKSFRKG